MESKYGKRSKTTPSNSPIPPIPPTSKLTRKLRDKTTKRAPTTKDFSSVAGYKPTSEQKDILETAITPGLKALVINAGAGSGKTSSLLMLEEVLPGIGQYTAFNTALVNEAKAKFKKATANTTHSLAFRAVGHKYAHRLNSSRVRSKVIANILGINDIPVDVLGLSEPKVLSASFLASQVTIAIRKFCQSADREVDQKHFQYIDGIDLPMNGKRTYDNNQLVREYLLPFAKKMWQDLSWEKGTLPYSHDCYVKAWQLGTGKDKPYIATDYILLDECQDTAPVFLDILQKQSHALVILVGDDNQQIYEWRGATNAMKSYSNAPRRLLSQSFRFGQSIADVANSVLSTLQDKTDLVMKGLLTIPSRIDTVGKPDCILSRTNASAVGTLLQKVEEGYKPHLIGGGADVISFVRAAKVLQQGQRTEHPQLSCFISWSEVQSYVKEDEGEDLKLLVKLIDDFGTQAILNALEDMPAEKEADLVLSTVHRSKGKEWATVKLAGDFLTDDKMNDSERRVLYVAVTRAKHVLDISDCPSFLPSKSKDSSKEIPGIEVRYTREMPTIAILEAYRSDLLDREGGAFSINQDESVSEGSESTYSPSSNPIPSTAETAAAVDGTTSVPQPQVFTFAYFNGKWVVRGPVDMVGKQVVVTKRGGIKCDKVLKSVEAKFPDVWLYNV